MIIKVLGSAAGGGFPQANCNCRNCADVRRGMPGLAAANAVVAGGERRWSARGFCSMPRRTSASRLRRRRELWPSPEGGVRCSPIKAVVLTNGDVDHVAGLLSLREGIAFTLYAAARVHAALGGQQHLQRARRAARAAHATCRLIEPLAASRWIDARSLRRARQGRTVPGGCGIAGHVRYTQQGDTLGLKLTDPASGAASFYIPACAARGLRPWPRGCEAPAGAVRRHALR